MRSEKTEAEKAEIETRIKKKEDKINLKLKECK